MMFAGIMDTMRCFLSLCNLQCAHDGYVIIPYRDYVSRVTRAGTEGSVSDFLLGLSWNAVTATKPRTAQRVVTAESSGTSSTTSLEARQDMILILDWV
jgi:hypothetical protein